MSTKTKTQTKKANKENRRKINFLFFERGLSDPFHFFLLSFFLSLLEKTVNNSSKKKGKKDLRLYSATPNNITLR